MRATLVCALAAAACSGSSPPPPLSSHHEAPPAVRRDTPAPHIGWAEHRFALAGLPAIAADGSLAVVAVDDGDGGRGYPNLRIEVRDRGDRVIEKRQILLSDDYERLVPGDDPGPELARRIADANTALADLHARHDLQTAVPLELEDPHETERLPITATGDDGLEVAWQAPRIVVRRGTEALATVDGSAWLPRAGKRCPACEPCANPAFLGAVTKSPRVDLVVVELAFSGTDTCWEPGHQFHVVAW
jgi:hypothetical protein